MKKARIADNSAENQGANRIHKSEQRNRRFMQQQKRKQLRNQARHFNNSGHRQPVIDESQQQAGPIRAASAEHELED